MADSIAPGALFGDDFRIERKLGEGGMGEVFLATQLSMEREVVVKTLLHAIASSEDGLARFRREARVLSRLHHPNIVVIHTFGQQPDGPPYLVLELVEGRSLAQLLIDHDGPIHPQRAVHLIEQLLSALAEAHAHDILHRDLKPENLMVTRTADGVERVKVLDFGIAKLLHQPTDTPRLTDTSAIIGTPQYMSPEQIQGGPSLDGRSDLYATGVILYELLTGHHPIQAETPMQFLFNQVSQPARSLRSFNDSLPAPLEDVIMRALEKDPDARFPDANAMLTALRDASDDLPEAPPTPTTHEPVDSPIATSATLPGVIPEIDTGESPRRATFDGGDAADLLDDAAEPDTIDDAELEPETDVDDPLTAQAALLEPGAELAPALLSEPTPSPRAPDPTESIEDDLLQPATPEPPDAIIEAKPAHPPSASDEAPPAGPPAHTRWVLPTVIAAIAVLILLLVIVFQDGDEASSATDAEATASPNRLTEAADVTAPPSPEPEPTSAGAAAPDTAAAQPLAGAESPEPQPLRVVDIAAAGHTTFAVMSDGTVRAWGSGYGWALGRNPAEGDVALPVQVPGVRGAERVYAGGRETAKHRVSACAVGPEAGLCWGDPVRLVGQPAGSSAAPPRPFPHVRASRDIAMVNNTTLIAKDDHSLISWSTRAPHRYSHSDIRRPAPASPITAVAAADRHACYVTRDGALSCWGDASVGRLGPGRSTTEDPTPVEAVEDVREVALGWTRTCVIDARNTLSCWGSDREGVEILARDAQTLDVSYAHACFATLEGMVWCWGDRDYGRLGVTWEGWCCIDTPQWVASLHGITIRKLALGHTHSCGLTDEGAVWCWGGNRFGQLGDGTLTDRFEAREVLHLTDPVLPEPTDGHTAWRTSPEQSTTPITPPEGCPGGPIEVRHSGGEPGTHRLTLRYATLYNTYGFGNINLADYDPTVPTVYGSGPVNAPRADAFRLRLAFTEHSTSEDTPQAGRPPIGRVIRGERDPGFHLSLYDRYEEAHRTPTHEQDPESAVTITRHDAEWLCGTLDVRGPWGFIRGPFAVPLRAR